MQATEAIETLATTKGQPSEPFDATVDFRFNIDLAKSEDASDSKRYIDGLASSEDLDAQGEAVVQKGMILDPLLKSGWINWDHLQGAKYLIGEPTEAQVVRIEDHPRLRTRAVSKGAGLYFKGFLYKGHPEAEAVWYHLNNPERTRPLAYSIQGRTLERDGHRLTKCELRHMAVTHQPVQKKSFADICKSMTLAKDLTLAGAEPLRLENLDGRLTSILWGACLKGCYEKSGAFHDGTFGLLKHLTHCKGYGLQSAVNFIKSLRASGIGR
jgi:hypothetical protein